MPSYREPHGLFPSNTDRALRGTVAGPDRNQSDPLAKTAAGDHHAGMRKIGLRLVIGFGILAGALFGAAGRLDLPFFWAFLGVMVATLTIGMSLMDPDLMRERVRPGAGGVDRHLRFKALPFFLIHLIVAGLDAGRFHWSGLVPAGVQMAALAVVAGSMGLSLWAVRVNRFYSPVVRIQKERGHHLVTAGPYRFLRHPGYAAAMLMMSTSGAALGSWWAIVPLIPMMGLILRRAVIEDRFLHRELEGYAAYAQRVRHRLIPGVW